MILYNTYGEKIMQKVRCIIHSVEFVIPTNDEEYSSGKFHDYVESLSIHTEQFDHCDFEEIKG